MAMPGVRCRDLLVPLKLVMLRPDKATTCLLRTPVQIARADAFPIGMDLGHGCTRESKILHLCQSRLKLNIHSTIIEKDKRLDIVNGNTYSVEYIFAPNRTGILG